MYFILGEKPDEKVRWLYKIILVVWVGGVKVDRHALNMARRTHVITLKDETGSGLRRFRRQWGSHLQGSGGCVRGWMAGGSLPC